MSETKKKIKVLICINNLYVGGTQRQLQNQLPYFDTNKFDISIVSFDSDTVRPSTNILFPKQISYFHIEMKNLWDLLGWYKTFKLVKRIQPDVMMTSLFWANTVGRSIGVFLKIPTIARYHNTTKYSSGLQKNMDIFLARYTKLFVSVSSEVADFMITSIPNIDSRMRVIPNGINLEIAHTYQVDLRNKVRTEMNVQDDNVLLLTVGRLIKQKNQTLMIESLSKIRETYPNVKLCIVGDGGQKEVLDELIKKLSLEKTVYFAGHQDNVHPYYMAADVYISTSKIEGMSNTQLEALVHGLPIITTYTGGVKELIREGENGFIISNHEPDGVCVAFDSYMKHDKMTLRQEALIQAQKFDIRKTVKKYEDLWLEVSTNKLTS